MVWSYMYAEVFKIPSVMVGTINEDDLLPDRNISLKHVKLKIRKIEF